MSRLLHIIYRRRPVAVVLRARPAGSRGRDGPCRVWRPSVSGSDLLKIPSRRKKTPSRRKFFPSRGSFFPSRRVFPKSGVRFLPWRCGSAKSRPPTTCSGGGDGRSGDGGYGVRGVGAGRHHLFCRISSLSCGTRSVNCERGPHWRRAVSGRLSMMCSVSSCRLGACAIWLYSS